ncbi:hypothetical protein BKA93DRAFT_32790 [Sparassis latifolia]
MFGFARLVNMPAHLSYSLARSFLVADCLVCGDWSAAGLQRTISRSQRSFFPGRRPCPRQHPNAPQTENDLLIVLYCLALLPSFLPTFQCPSRAPKIIIVSPLRLLFPVPVSPVCALQVEFLVIYCHPRLHPRSPPHLYPNSTHPSSSCWYELLIRSARSTLRAN